MNWIDTSIAILAVVIAGIALGWNINRDRRRVIVKSDKEAVIDAQDRKVLKFDR